MEELSIDRCFLPSLPQDDDEDDSDDEEESEEEEAKPAPKRKPEAAEVRQAPPVPHIYPLSHSPERPAHMHPMHSSPPLFLAAMMNRNIQAQQI